MNIFYNPRTTIFIMSLFCLYLMVQYIQSYNVGNKQTSASAYIYMF